MRQFAWIVLFVSLGLNLGLAWRVLSERNDGRDLRYRSAPERSERNVPRGDRPWRRPSFSVLADSSGWADMARHRLDRLAVRLGLDGEQRRRFTVVHLAAATEIRRHRLALSAARHDLYSLYAAPEIDRGAVAAAAAEMAALQGRLDALVADVLSEELMLLDPEQRERYLALMPWEVATGQAADRGHGRSRPQHWRGNGERPGPRGLSERDTVGR